MRTPMPQGLPVNYCLSERDCKHLEVPKYFSELPVEKWLDFQSVAKAQINITTPPEREASKSLHTFLSHLRKIKENKRTRFNMTIYCGDVLAYYKNSTNKKEYYTTYDKELSLFHDKMQQRYLGRRTANLVTERTLLQDIENMERELRPGEGSRTGRGSISGEKGQYLERTGANTSSEVNINTKKCTLLKIHEYGQNLYEKYVQGREISEQEINIMKICLSSTLDLIDLNKHGQLKTIFKDDYEIVMEKYRNIVKVKPYEIDKRFKAHFEIMALKCKEDNNTKNARDYLHKTLGGKKEYKMLEILLDILDEEQFFLRNISNKSLITEGDILSRIWFPVLKKLFSYGGELVRIKLGESIFPYSQAQKQFQYTDSKNVKAFKIDIRFIYDKNGHEHDVGAAEVAREIIDEAKILHDKSKLIREGKDVLDNILDIVIPEEEARKAAGYTLQIKGLCAQIITIHLASSGLYVAKPLFTIYFPVSLSELCDFSKGMQDLLHFVHLVEGNAKILEKALNSNKRRACSIDGDYNAEELKQPAHSMLTLMKPTYYTPSNHDRTYSVFDFSNMHKTSSSTPSPPPPIIDEEDYDYDENGWVLLKNGHWLHKESSITLDVSPYGD